LRNFGSDNAAGDSSSSTSTVASAMSKETCVIRNEPLSEACVSSVSARGRSPGAPTGLTGARLDIQDIGLV